MSEVTLILNAINRGETVAAEQLLPLVYDSLRRLAEARMAREVPGNTLQPTALVHEAWLELVGQNDRNLNWKSRAYFFSAAAEAMRRILIWNARKKKRLKRGGGQQFINIEDVDIAEAGPDEQVLLVNEALERLERVNPQHARVAVLKYFGGMTNKEVAEVLEVAERTVDRYWLCAKMWLFNELQAAAK